MKKLYIHKMRIGSLPLSWNGRSELPRILFGHEQGNLRSTRLWSSLNMAEVRPEEEISSHILTSMGGGEEVWGV